MRKVKTMAREIKFRAWSKVEEEMVYGIDLTTQDGTAHPINGNWDNIMSLDERVELMQYTGLKDKNGTEIYEGDIVLTDNSIDNFHTELRSKKLYEVRYWDGSFMLRFDDKNIDYLSTGETCCEVIGNIYENPDLLEGEPNE